MRPKMGDLEAIIAQSHPASAFGAKGFWLILIGMCLNWSRSVLFGTSSLFVLYYYGPQAASTIGAIFKRLG